VEVVVVRPSVEEEVPGAEVEGERAHPWEEEEEDPLSASTGEGVVVLP